MAFRLCIIWLIDDVEVPGEERVSTAMKYRMRKNIVASEFNVFDDLIFSSRNSSLVGGCI